MPDPALATRYTLAQSLAAEAGVLALDDFRHWDRLTIESKGPQDFVSEADRNVEAMVRARLAAAFPDDAITGEEAAATPGSSGFTWVIDPIDGTTNFINGIPQWCVLLACVHQGRCVIGVVHDPVHDEMHHACAGGGAFCNDRAIRCSAKTVMLAEAEICIKGVSTRNCRPGATARWARSNTSSSMRAGK